MRKSFWLAILAFALAASCPAQTTCAATKADETAVVETLRTMYAAATTDDLDKFHTVVTINFHAFDGGKVFHGDELMNLIKAAHAKGMVWVWTVTTPEVHVTCDTAWIAYTNVGSADGKPMTWLESAMLKKEQNTWKIEFFHSTRVP